MKAAEEDEVRVLALVAMGIDEVQAEQDVQQENFLILQESHEHHLKAPLEEAHKIPNGWKPKEKDMEEDTIKGTYKMKTKTLIKIIIIIAGIGGGGSALAAFLGVIGG